MSVMLRMSSSVKLYVAMASIHAASVGTKKVYSAVLLASM